MKRQTFSFLHRHGPVASAAGLICFIVYLSTMCRTVSFIDSGELASVVCILGIAHPTGYPLFSILAHCFLWIPIPSEEILRLNVFSAIVVALGVGVFYYVLIAAQRHAQSMRRKGSEKGRVEGIELRTAAFISALIFGFSTTVWSQSVTIEVYGLHIVLVLLTFYAFLEGLRMDANGSGHIPPQMVVAAFLLGLSFANHMTTILVVPALLFLYLKNYGFNRPAALRSARLFPFFALGVSLYLYLPFRARLQPPMNWGYAAEIDRLLWHVSGKQYRNWMFSSFDSAEKQLSYFVNHFHVEFNWVIIGVLLFGAWQCFKSSREVFWFLVVGFVSCLFYSVNYDIHDIDSYFLLAYIVSGIFVFFGVHAIVDATRRSAKKSTLLVVALALLMLPGLQLYLNRSEVDESDNSLVADYTHNVLSGVQPNAVILSYQWDYFVAPVQYYQLVRKERPDVVVIDKELLRRSWYFIQLKSRFPWLIERSQQKVDAFLAELYKFEHDLPYDPLQIESRYVDMVNELIDCSMQDRPVYVGPEIEPGFGRQYQKIPTGLMFRLTRNPDSVQINPIRVEFHPATIETRLTRGLRALYVQMLTSTSGYFLGKNRLSDADSCIEKALSVDPTYRPARALRQAILLAGSPAKR
ncbi:MAG: DUF2723 domain-containing protein [Ignavibacteriales bacterium]|nr:DUF2723 domain-containing protein [Ignavibacteriales bacterium]